MSAKKLAVSHKPQQAIEHLAQALCALAPKVITPAQLAALVTKVTPARGGLLVSFGDAGTLRVEPAAAAKGASAPASYRAAMKDLGTLRYAGRYLELTLDLAQVDRDEWDLSRAKLPTTAVVWSPLESNDGDLYFWHPAGVAPQLWVLDHETGKVTKQKGTAEGVFLQRLCADLAAHRPAAPALRPAANRGPLAVATDGLRSLKEHEVYAVAVSGTRLSAATGTGRAAVLARLSRKSLLLKKSPLARQTACRLHPEAFDVTVTLEGVEERALSEVLTGERRTKSDKRKLWRELTREVLGVLPWSEAIAADEEAQAAAMNELRPEDAAQVLVHEEEVTGELYRTSARHYFREHLVALAPAVAKALLTAKAPVRATFAYELGQSAASPLASNGAYVAAIKALFKKSPTVLVARALEKAGFPAPTIRPDDIGNDEARPLNVIAYR